MKPVPDYQRVNADLFVWNGYNPECKTDCSSAAVRTPAGFVLIDPVPLEEQAIGRMVGEGKIAAIVLTNGNHGRNSECEKQRLDIPIYAPEGARHEVAADRWIKDGEILFEVLRAISLPGGGTGETAYLAPGVLILGDALVSLDELMILPDRYCQNARLLRESLHVLSALDFEIVCFAHGLPIVQGAKEKIASVVQ